jgi:hypothetical protein
MQLITAITLLVISAMLWTVVWQMKKH